MHSIVVEDYDPQWPDRFGEIHAELAAALDGLAGAIEHVGSTAVPGLAAKPILDIDVLLKNAGDLPQVVERLEPLGYRYQGDLGIAGRDAFQQPAGTFPHHLYVCAPNGEEYHRHLAFRDYLRGHADISAHYARLKRELAARAPADRDEYTRGKSHFVVEVLLLAMGSDAP